MDWVIGACGVFSLCGAVLDWDWFMNSRKARFFVSVFGRDGARVFYGLMGAALVVLGVLLGSGVIEGTRGR